MTTVIINERSPQAKAFLTILKTMPFAKIVEVSNRKSKLNTKKASSKNPLQLIEIASRTKKRVLNPSQIDKIIADERKE